MSHAGRKFTTKTHGKAHGEGSTSGGLWSRSRLGPGNEQPLPYAAAGNGMKVFPGSVSAWAAVPATPTIAEAAAAEPMAMRRMRFFMSWLLVGRFGLLWEPASTATLAASLCPRDAAPGAP